MRRSQPLSSLKGNALIITGVYLLISLLWSAFSKRLGAGGSEGSTVMSVLKTYNGLFFIGGTSLLLYITARYALKKEQCQQEKKQEAEILYKTVFDHVSDLLFVAPVPEKNTPLRFQQWNPPARNILGYNIEQTGSLSLEDLSTSSLKENVKEQEHQISQHEHYIFDWEFVHQSGRSVPVKVQTTKASISGKEVVIAAARDVSAYREAVKNIHQLSYYDKRTHLPNYDFFLRHLQQVEPKQNRGVIALNFNRFRRINETMGIEMGNRVLTAIAEKLQLVVENEEDLARKTNDEFLLFARPAEDRGKQLMEKLRGMFERPLEINKEEIFLSFTAGLAWDEDGSKEAEVLVQQADIAFSHAKRKNRSYEIYDPGMEREARTVYIIENELHHALARQEMFLMYQPFVFGKERTTKGMEALLRWKHSSRGMISPSTFIPIAEENGLIHQLGRWVLHQVCREIGPVLKRHPDWTVAVNISSQQLEDPYFADELNNIVEAYEVTPSQLELEITERTVMQQDLMLPILRCLKKRGFRLSLDDFGTGYSSLSQLKELPVDTLKIDRSFIDDMNEKEANLAIVKTIIDTAENLNMKVIAEGIEEEKQASELLALQCFYFQGYYFSIPKPMQEFSWGKEA